MRKLGFLIAAAAVIAFAAIAMAGPSDLDPTFDEDGVREMKALAGAEGLALDSSGRAVVVGSASSGGFGVQRLTTAGTPDPAFNGGQPVVITAEGLDEGTAVTIDGSGRIYVGGQSEEAGKRVFAVARLTASGALDTTWNPAGPTPGIAEVPVSVPTAGGATPTDVSNASIALSPSSGLLVAGTASEGDGATGVIVRLQTTGPVGTRDGAFGGGDGVASVPNTFFGAVTAVAGGPFYAGGVDATTGGWVVRGFAVNGTTLNTFGSSGRVLVDDGGGTAPRSIDAMLTDSLNHIVLSGRASTPGDGSTALGVARLRADSGAPDPGFNGGKTRVVPMPGVPDGQPGAALAIGPGGSIVTAGTLADADYNESTVVARFTSAGELDPTFSPNGTPAGTRVVRISDARSTAAHSVGVMGDGRVAFAGTVVRPGTNTGDIRVDVRNAFAARLGDPGAVAPEASTDAPADVRAGSATLRATVNPNGRATEVAFELGTTTDYGRTLTVPGGAGAGTTPIAASIEASGLEPSTTYHFRVRATNNAGTTVGQDATFTTLAAEDPRAEKPAQPVTPAGALLGPDRVRFGERALLTAGVTGATRFEWDSDGDGGYDVDGGAEPRLSITFRRPGKRRVGLRATGPGGEVVLHRDIEVTEPARVGITFSPPHPKPGQKVSFKVRLGGEHGDGPDYYAWKVPGLKPLDPTITLPASRSPKAASPPQVVPDARKLTLAGADPTIKPRYERSFKKPGVYRVEVSPVGTHIDAPKAAADIVVLPKGGAGLKAKRGGRPAGEPEPCGPGTQIPCPAVTVSQDETVLVGETVDVGVLATFEEVCYGADPGEATGSLEKELPVTAVTAAKDRGYPPFEGALSPGSSAVSAITGVGVPPGAAQAAASAGGGARTARVARASIDTEGKKAYCERFPPPKVVQWSFGDGSKNQPAKVNLDSPIRDYQPAEHFPHTYPMTPGTYTLTVLAEVFTLVGPPPPLELATNGKEPKKPELTFQPRLVRLTRPVVVREAYCKPLTVATVRVQAIPAVQGNAAIPAALAAAKDGCWRPLARQDPSRDIYAPLPGNQPSFGGLVLEAGTVDPELDLIDHPGEIKFHDRETGYTGTLGEFGALANLEPDKSLGYPAIALPTAPWEKGRTYDTYGGLEVAGARAWVRPGGAPPIMRLSVRPPKPIKGGTPSVDLGAPAVTGGARSGAEKVPPGSANTLRFDGTDIGPFYTENVTLTRYSNGAWSGGGKLGLRAPIAFTLDATDVPEGAAQPVGDIACDQVASPNGIGINADGSFWYGGAIVKQNALTLPPLVSIPCLALRGKADPFLIEGRLQLQVPAGDVAPMIDGQLCGAVAKLAKDQSTQPCNREHRYVNPTKGELLFVRVAGRLTLMSFLPITGFAELEEGPGLRALSAGGHFEKDFGVGILEASVRGKVWDKPQKAFQFVGHIEVREVPLIGGFGATGAVSSLGIGVCVDGGPGGAYRWAGEIEFVAWGCDINSLDILIEPVAAMSSRAAWTAPRARSSALPVTKVETAVPEKLEYVHFRLTGDDRPPRVTLTDPKGRKIVDTGRDIVEKSPLAILHWPESKQTLVSVRKPAKGEWTIESTDGTRIVKARREESIPPPRILAAVKGERLVYEVREAPGQRVQFVEEGRGVAEGLGAVKRGKATAAQARSSIRNVRGSLKLPHGDEGSAGKRRIYAVVERNGLMTHKILVDSYRADGAPKVTAPRRIKVRPASWGRTGAALRWARVRGAATYDVTAKYGNGLTEHFVTKAPKAALRYFRSEVATKLEIRVTSAKGVRSKVTRRTIDARRIKPVRRRR